MKSIEFGLSGLNRRKWQSANLIQCVACGAHSLGRSARRLTFRVAPWFHAKPSTASTVKTSFTLLSDGPPMVTESVQQLKFSIVTFSEFPERAKNENRAADAENWNLGGKGTDLISRLTSSWKSDRTEFRLCVPVRSTERRVEIA